MTYWINKQKQNEHGGKENIKWLVMGAVIQRLSDTLNAKEKLDKLGKSSNHLLIVIDYLNEELIEMAKNINKE